MFFFSPLFAQLKVLPVREQVLWNKGLEDVAEYRIPVITSTVSGYLIAAVEARKYSGGDSGPKFLAVRRSKDGGRSYRIPVIIINDYLVHVAVVEALGEV